MIILFSMGLTSCQLKKDEQFYLAHPKELQSALKSCPTDQPVNLSCSELEQIGSRMNSLAYQLQLSPQKFGNSILALQQKIAAQKIELKEAGTNADLQASIEQNQHDLKYYMAVVKWLESPES